MTPLACPHEAIAITAPSCLFTVAAETLGASGCLRPHALSSGKVALRNCPRRGWGTL